MIFYNLLTTKFKFLHFNPGNVCFSGCYGQLVAIRACHTLFVGPTEFARLITTSLSELPWLKSNGNGD